MPTPWRRPRRREPTRIYVWHRSTDLAGADVAILPGGFSYGDYLRPGAIARFSPVMRAVAAHAAAGRPVLGICNGFQILCEAQLLPGALVRNGGLSFVCRPVRLRVETDATPFTARYRVGQQLTMPVAHGDGRYVADDATLDRLEREERVVFRYVDGNPNGAMRDIAGITNEGRNVVGLMPHPERASEAAARLERRRGGLRTGGRGRRRLRGGLMESRSVCTLLASLALIAAPLAAQDTTTAPKDTTGAHKDSVAVAAPVESAGVRTDTAAAVQPAAPPAAAAAATADNVVRPGMTEAEVRSRWGDPLATRTANDWTYLFYRNQREHRVGFEDVVFLQHGQVMDAIVRSPDHVYAGVSSSPEGRVPVFTPPQGQRPDSTKGAAVTGVQVKPDQ